MSRLRSRYRTVTTVIVVLALVLGVAACGSSSNSKPPGSGGGGSSAAPGASQDTVTMAGSPSEPVNWILPFPDPAHLSPVNLPVYELLFRPLYWFGAGTKTVIDQQKSLAEMPVYNKARTSVTITLKPWIWSDGEPIDAADVAFWINFAKGNKHEWGPYVPGLIPDDIVSYKIDSKRTITLKLNHAYNTNWFTYSQLSQIFPFPKAWDRTSASTQSNCTNDVADCKAVWKYLYAASKNLSGYASSPVFKVVDGPWKLTSFSSSGAWTMVPNPKYSGSDKPKLKALKEVPFTTDSAEYNVLRSGSTIDVGYAAAQDLPQTQVSSTYPPKVTNNPLAGSYELQPTVPYYGPEFMSLNYASPQAGPMFKQLYFRQALQSIVDSNTLISKVFSGYGIPTNGPVPSYSSGGIVAPIENDFPYPFSITKAEQYLKDNGWKVVPGGTSTCEKPGTAAGDCGAGIAKGAPASFQYLYASGSVAEATFSQVLQSNAREAGITINLKSLPSNEEGEITFCRGAKCDWQSDSGGWGYVYYPTGEMIFKTGALVNSGSYSNPEMDRLIDATTTEPGTQALYDYQKFAVKQLPVIWEPEQLNVVAVANGLMGVVQNPYGNITPEDWYFKTK